MKTLKEPLSLLTAGLCAAAFTAIWAFTNALEPLILGWWHVLARSAPRIEVSLAGVTTGVLCLGATALTMHWIAGGIYREIRLKQGCTVELNAWRWSWTVGLVAAVILMFVAGLVGVGLFRTTNWFLGSLSDV